MAVPAGYATMSGGGHSITCLLGDTPPKVTDGYAVWDTIVRLGRDPLTIRKGSAALTVELPLLLDSVAAGESAATKMTALEEMAGLGLTVANTPTITFDANMPRQAKLSANDWVVSALDWGDGVYDETATLLRQPVTVTLLALRTSSISTLAASQSFRTDTMQAGDTLRDVARRELGDATRWTEIRDLNASNPRTPKTSTTPVGKAFELKIPPKDS